MKKKSIVISVIPVLILTSYFSLAEASGNSGIIKKINVSSDKKNYPMIKSKKGKNTKILKKDFDIKGIGKKKVPNKAQSSSVIKPDSVIEKK